MRDKILIFGGTTEGRELGQILSENNFQITLLVATEYGKNIVSENENLKVLSGRYDENKIMDFLEENDFSFVIDATHPYATIVTENIKNACGKTKTKYFRFIRGESEKNQDVTYVSSAEEAINILKDSTGNILLTTGSKDLESFTKIDDYESRVFVRILPMVESLEKAQELGFKNSNIICMQGPFSCDMNASTIKSVNAKYLITKDSGDIGGYSNKLLAAEKTGTKVIVISRSTAEEGFTFSEMLKLFNINREKKFPLFIDLKDKPVTIIGGGNIATRRAEILLNFGADITIISPALTSDLAKLKIKHIKRRYEEGDTKGAYLVIAATNNREVNRKIGEEGKKNNIFVNVSDVKEECNFWFPGIIENDEFIAGMVSKAGNHEKLKQMLNKVRGIINHEEN